MSEHCTCGTSDYCQVHDEIDRLRARLAEEKNNVLYEIRTITINGDELRPFGKALLAAVDCTCGGRFFFNVNVPLPWADYCNKCGKRAEVTSKSEAAGK